jgi:hypothetical protein
VVPLYGVTAGEHDAIAGAPVFDRIAAGLDEARARGVRIRIHTLALRRTLPGLADLAGFVRERWRSRLAVGLLREKPGFDWGSEAPTFGEIRRALPTEVSLLVAPPCLRVGDGDGPIPTDPIPEEPPALLAHLYFLTQARRFAPVCAACPARRGCPGIVDRYLA